LRNRLVPATGFLAVLATGSFQLLAPSLRRAYHFAFLGLSLYLPRCLPLSLLPPAAIFPLYNSHRSPIRSTSAITSRNCRPTFCLICTSFRTTDQHRRKSSMPGHGNRPGAPDQELTQEQKDENAKRAMLVSRFLA
jgi:hypothetical protein